MSAAPERDSTILDFIMPEASDVPHYYGHVVRRLNLIAGIGMLIASPLYADAFFSQILFIAGAAMFLFVLEILTDPWSKAVMAVDVICATIGVVVYQSWAIAAYAHGTFFAFALREALAIIFVLAFYYGIRTLFAMLMNMIPEDENKTDPELVQESERALDGLGRPAALEDDRGGDEGDGDSGDD